MTTLVFRNAVPSDAAPCFQIESDAYEGDEAASLVLQFAQLDEMVHALFFRFDVAVEHGGIGGQAYFVSFLGGVEPHLAANFVVADDAAHARVEDFGAAAGERIDSGFFHLDQRVFDRELREARVVVDFHHGESFQVDLREALLEAADAVDHILRLVDSAQ